MESQRTTIDKLKERIGQSDEKAFRQLFNTYYARLLNYVFVIVKNRESAEDIVLEVFNAIWEKRFVLHEVLRFENYLYVSARNKTLDYHRKNSKMLNVCIDAPHYKEIITHLNPEKRLLNEELYQVVDRAILSLPEKTRLVYRLVKEDGLKYHEAAKVMGTSPKTVNNQILAAIKTIRKEITNYQQEDLGMSKLHVLKSFFL